MLYCGGLADLIGIRKVMVLITLLVLVTGVSSIR